MMRLKIWTLGEKLEGVHNTRMKNNVAGDIGWKIRGGLFYYVLYAFSLLLCMFVTSIKSKTKVAN